MARILVTGASGLLGVNLALQAAKSDQVIGVTFSQELKNVPFDVLQADLTDPVELRKTIEQTNPELVINCAAMADIDSCENDPETAEKINAYMPQYLVEICKRNNIRLVHISTDAVFDGKRGDYTEEDHPNPLSVYARTKLEGETSVSNLNAYALILRVNFYGYSINGKRSLAEFFLYNLATGTAVKGFTDVIFCPLLTQHLSEIIFKMLDKDLKGIYHLVSSEGLSKYEFGLRIAETFDLNPALITSAKLSEGGLKAPRALNLRLRIEKLIHDLGEIPPGQSEGLQKFYQLYKEGYPQQLRSFI